MIIIIIIIIIYTYIHYYVFNTSFSFIYVLYFINFQTKHLLCLPITVYVPRVYRLVVMLCVSD